MKKLKLKGIDPTFLTKYVKKSALLAVKKDSIISDILPIYIFKDKIVSVKQDGSGSTFKLWEIPLNEFITNHEEVSEKLGDRHCRVALFSCKQFVVGGLKHFNSAIDLDLIINDVVSSYDAVEYVTVSNEKIKIRFSVSDASHAFKKIKGGWEFVDKFFSTDEDSGVKSSFVLSDKELKEIKSITKMESVVDKKHEFVELSTRGGNLIASSHSVDLTLHPSNINISEVKIKNDVVRTLCDENYNVFIKKFNGTPLIIFKSTDTLTQQSIVLLTEFNSNVNLQTVEDEIAQVDFSEWDSQEENPLF